MGKTVTVSQRRNIAFCGHGSCGKTSLIDSLLVATGAVSGEHSVDNGTSVCDFDPEEKLHHHTVEAKVTHCEHHGLHFSLLDTPGYPDFIGQTIGALAGVDCAAVCINAHSGIEVNTRRVFHAARQAGLANVLVITRLDSESIDFQELIRQIIDTFGDACALVNVPEGLGPDLIGVIDVLEVGDQVGYPLLDLDRAREHLIECLVEADEDVLAKYLDGETPSPEELRGLFPKAVLAGSLIPIFCVSSKQRVGLEALLTGLGQCAPSPDMFCRHGIGPDGESVELCADSSAPLVARVFETHIDPFVQKLSYIRVYSGTLTKDQTVHIAGTRTNLKMPQILEMQGNQTSPIDVAEAGQIVAVAKQTELHTGTLLGDVELPPIPFPKPMVGLALAPKSRGDENKLAAALNKLVEEDATLRLDRDSQTS
ncbi:MAG: GTP-binding protein, partial [Aureliella sp.]